MSRYVRSVEQLEILLLLSREPHTVWTSKRVYDAILSTPLSVERWLEDLTRKGLLEKISAPAEGYRCSTDPDVRAQTAALGSLYSTSPVRVIEAIYKRETNAAQSFADAFKLKNPEPGS